MIKLAILFGGKSFEHEVSIKSATNIYDNINKEKYLISLIYIDKDDNFFYTPNFLLKKMKLIKNLYSLKKYDVVFPIMHGNYCEDGKLQGLFDMIGVKYVGCNLLTSALCMDKVYTKKVLDTANIPNAKYLYYYKDFCDLKEINKNILKKIGYPCFIKPANAGSSVGVSKCIDQSKLKECLEQAFIYDKKVLIERHIKGKEVEVGILGNKTVVISNIGQVLAADEFYTYDAKYNNPSSKTKVPADLKTEISDKIKNYALIAYRELECSSLSRIDFFVEDKTNKIYLNEINTMPGFTDISMYPILMENMGIDYKSLLDKLIAIALE